MVVAHDVFAGLAVFDVLLKVSHGIAGAADRNIADSIHDFAEEARSKCFLLEGGSLGNRLLCNLTKKQKDPTTISPKRGPPGRFVSLKWIVSAAGVICCYARAKIVALEGYLGRRSL